MYETLLKLRDFIEYENRQDKYKLWLCEFDNLLARIDCEQEAI